MWPKVSFIIPTYNAEKYLDVCLGSIIKQNYPKEQIEIIIIDGGSDDRTIEISLKYGCTILKNEKRIAEYGKAIGIKQSTGELFILMDSDNEIVELDWIQKMIRPILENERIFGVESPFSCDKKLSSLNRYFARLRIADPLARKLVSNPSDILHKQGYDVLKFEKSARIITGANGFLWNKKLVLEKGGWDEKFEEANYSSFISAETGFGYAIPHEASVRHYYCEGIGSYLKKRKKIALKAKNRIKSHQTI